jgi:DNA mismatch endonuclease (patch repair protein)
MTDTLSPIDRSRRMSLIKSSGNESTEAKFARLLRKYRMTGWRRAFPLFGRPDFVWPRQRLALFVDGCFWHGCPIHARVPKSRQMFWRSKLDRNRERDVQVNHHLSASGWTVIRIWECDLHESRIVTILAKIQEVLSIPHS